MADLSPVEALEVVVDVTVNIERAVRQMRQIVASYSDLARTFSGAATALSNLADQLEGDTSD